MEISKTMQAGEMGTQWEAEKKLWKMDYKTAKSLKLHNRIIKKTSNSMAIYRHYRHIKTHVSTYRQSVYI